MRQREKQSSCTYKAFSVKPDSNANRPYHAAQCVSRIRKSILIKTLCKGVREWGEVFIVGKRFCSEQI